MADEPTRERLRALLDGTGPPLLLGMTEPSGEQLPPGTAAVIATSGSTGIPKRVVLSRRALLASVAATAERIGEGSWLRALPTNYIAGLQVVLRSIVSGTAVSAMHGPFTAESFVAAASAMPTAGRRFTSMVPAQLHRLVDAAATDASVADALAGFDAILIGGQRLDPGDADRAVAVGASVVRTYGSTETCGGCVYDGVPLAGVQVRVVGGEVRIAAPLLADGYLGAPEATDSVFVIDQGTRWYRTGDTGSYQDGVLRVTGRADNVIVSGGINVSLDRVQSAVRTVPALAEAIVVAVPDRHWGEASIVILPAATAQSETLLATAREAVAAQLGAHARPARLLAVETIPTLASGKPDRAALRALAIQVHR